MKKLSLAKKPSNFFFLMMIVLVLLSIIKLINHPTERIAQLNIASYLPQKTETVNVNNTTKYQLQLKAEIQQLITEKNLYNPPRGNVRFLVISDLNSAYGSTEYEPEVQLGLDLIPFWQPDLVICSGDMIAGQKSSLTPTQIRAMWGAFDAKIAKPLREMKIPFGFTVGNHDASSAVAFDKNKFLFQQERDLAVEYWHNSEHNSGVTFIDRFEFPFYYTFSAQDIFFLVWDGSSSRIPPEKLAWVEKSLNSPEAKQAKMRIVIGHLPLYAVAVGRDERGEVLDDAVKIQKMLEKYQVHTYISGHHHAYYPAHKGNLQLLHTGLLGSGVRPLLQGDLPPVKTITVVDISFAENKLTTYTTYRMDTLELVEYEELPRLLIGHNGMVIRRDIEWENLTTTEKLSCEKNLGQFLCQP